MLYSKCKLIKYIQKKKERVQIIEICYNVIILRVNLRNYNYIHLWSIVGLSNNNKRTGSKWFVYQNVILLNSIKYNE